MADATLLQHLVYLLLGLDSCCAASQDGNSQLTQGHSMLHLELIIDACERAGGLCVALHAAF